MTSIHAEVEVVDKQENKKLMCFITFTNDRIQLFSEDNNFRSPLQWYLWEQVKSFFFYDKILRLKVYHLNQRRILYLNFPTKDDVYNIEYIVSCQYQFIRRCSHVGKVDKMLHWTARKYVFNSNSNLVMWPHIICERNYGQHVTFCNTLNNGAPINNENLITNQNDNKSEKIDWTESLSFCSNIKRSENVLYHSYFDNKPLDKDKLNQIDIYNIVLLGILQFDYANKEKYNEILKVMLEDKMNMKSKKYKETKEEYKKKKSRTKN